ncbi:MULTISPECIES: aspartyl-phosphate phosphatase Spo0E family protein [unclassified Virgibacillus]|uniref:aspartyl-phosphate phosphatase Spo0E family protein n=1 Tax=unclassified Virgibacillus TaxID=2620237 RepID=UPI0024DE451E|nr:aspartyl-phosphate phosphatase Spo0E family protein [Virgibacillus sp. LDC-1]
MYTNDRLKLLQRIESLRQRMTTVALEKGLTSLESISISQELDRLLNNYEHMKQNDFQATRNREVNSKTPQ